VSKERQGRVEKPPAEAIVDFIREGMQAANRLKRRRPEYLPPLVPDCGWDRGDGEVKQGIFRRTPVKIIVKGRCLDV
jgi:hypothetical protein